MNDKALVKAYSYFSLLKSRLHHPLNEKKGLPCLDLEKEISRYRTAIVYAGLSSFRAESPCGAVDLIQYAFRNTENWFIPGFTPSFRRTGVYSVVHSRPEVGAFSKNVFKLSLKRTLDPIHSLFIMNGDLPYADTMGDTFDPDGIYKSFTTQDACIVNIGTPEIVSTNLHYSERFAGLPYLERENHHGVVILPNGKEKEINHTSFKYKNRISWNRKKIERLLVKNNCMNVGLWNGALCRVIDGEASMSCLHSALTKDPYFMVTF